MKPSPLRAAAAAFIAAIAAGPAPAGSVFIANHSFETPALADGDYTVNSVPSWTVQPFGNAAGVYNPPVSILPNVPVGLNTCYNDGTAVSQVTAALLAANVRYTLRVAVVARIDSFGFGGGEISLRAGGEPLKYQPIPGLAPGQATEVELRLVVAASNPLLGQPIEIELRSYGVQTNFDNVRLDTEPHVPQTLLVPSQYMTIQGAIDAAFDGDEIVVAPGTYTENVRMTNVGVRLRSSGGDGVTTIDGALLDRTVTIESQNPDFPAALEGFTIRGGRVEFGDGGGLAIFDSDPLIADCVFLGNYSGSNGGAIGASGSAPRIERCAFRENEADDFGGAISIFGPESGEPALIRDCDFEDNEAGFGAGAALISAAGVTFEDCTFSGNTADGNGGALDLFALDAAVRRCVFDGNNAFGSGGAIVFGESLFDASGRPAGAPGRGFIPFLLPLRLTVDGCVFTGNAASDYGGAISIISGSPFPALGAARNSLFIGNRALNAAGGAIVLREQPINPFPDQRGSSEFIFPIRFDIGGCTIAQNFAPIGAGVAHIAKIPDGGPALELLSVMRVSGSILWGNRALKDGVESVQLLLDFPLDRVDRSCVEGLDLLPGTGSIGDDPLFVNEFGPDGLRGSGDEDLRLGAGSPCVDSGDASGMPGDTATDALGAPRGVDDPSAPNTGVPGFGIAWVDMGALERQVASAPECPGDVDGDGDVDFVDLNSLLFYFGVVCR